MNAREWLGTATDNAHIALLGAPISTASISPSDAWATPAAFREGLARFPLYDAEHAIDLSPLRVHDLGDVDGDHHDESAAAAHARIHAATAAATAPVVVVIGGDNSLTYPAMTGLMSARPDQWGLLTLDAHHDVRPLDDGPKNGTPVRQLVEAGLPGTRVAQLGIHPFGNSAESAAFARNHNFFIHPLGELRKYPIHERVRAAIGQVCGEGARLVYADMDVDVVDRAAAPACPASLPGGISAADFCAAAFALGQDRRVVGLDLCEVDSTRDVNGITVRLMCQAFMSFCAGVAQRLQLG